MNIIVQNFTADCADVPMGIFIIAPVVIDVAADAGNLCSTAECADAFRIHGVASILCLFAADFAQKPMSRCIMLPVFFIDLMRLETIHARLTTGDALASGTVNFMLSPAIVHFGTIGTCEPVIVLVIRIVSGCIVLTGASRHIRLTAVIAHTR